MTIAIRKPLTVVLVAIVVLAPLTVSVVATSHNPPEADAGEDGSVDEGTPFPLNGAESSDNGSIESYHWEIVAGDGGSIENQTAESTEVTFPDPGSYSVELTVTDNNGLTDTDIVNISVLDATDPTITSFEVSNPPGDDIQISFDSNEELTAISVSITSDGDTDSLDEADFDETGSAGSFTYVANYTPGGDGTYTATLNSAQDSAGNDGADGQSDSITLDSTSPEITSFTVTNPSGQDVQVSFDSNEQLATIEVAISDADTATLNEGDFNEIDNGDGSFTYEETYSGSTDGTYTATLNTAEDDDGNDGASGQSDSVTIDTIEPNISSFSVSNPSGRDIHITFDSDEQLATIEVAISGAETATLDEGDFDETDNGDGTFTYEETYTGSSDGNYEVTLKSAVDSHGNDGGDGGPSQTDTVSVDTAAPSISAYSAINPSGQDIEVSFNSDEELDAISVSISGPESGTLTRDDFTQAGGLTFNFHYEAVYESNSDGEYTATLDTAEDSDGNDGASGQTDTVTIDTTDPGISSFQVTNPSGQDVQVSFDSDEQLSSIEVEITGAESSTLQFAAFTETDNGDGSFTYTAVYSGSTDGTYEATLNTAEDDHGNDGANGQSDSVEVDTAPPVISSFTASNPSGQDVQVSVNSTEELSAINVTISNAESATLTVSNFTESEDAAGNFTYTATYSGSSDGIYEATLNEARDAVGNNYANREFASVEIGDGGGGDGGDGGSGGGGGGGGGSGGGGGGGGAGSSGTTTSSTQLGPNQLQVGVENAKRVQPLTVHLAAMDDDPDVGTELTTLRITPGGATDFEILIDRAGTQPADVTPLGDSTGHAGLAYFTLDHEVPDDDIASARLTFRVSKAQLDAWGADSSSVTVYRYEDGDWVAYATDLVGEDGASYQFAATFPGLSVFAVGADGTAPEADPTQTSVPTEEGPAPDVSDSGTEPQSTSTATPAEPVVEEPGGFRFDVPDAIFVVALLVVLFAVGFFGVGSLYGRYRE